MITLGIAGLWQLGDILQARMYFVGLIVQYLLVRNAARIYGIEVVTNVLAVTATEHPPKRPELKRKDA
jgi:hypothetical protein